LRDAPDFAISRGARKVALKQGNDRGSLRMHINPKEGHPDMDYAEHLRTYSLFCKGTLYLTITVVVIVALMGYFLT